VRLAQLGKSETSTVRCLRVLDGIGEKVDDVVVSAELSEVLERQIDRPNHGAGPAQITEFVKLSLPAGHARTLHLRADPPLHWD
jgi:hypothetical protein